MMMGTAPEMAVYRALEKMGLQAGVDFIFQSSQMGGRMERGGAVIDFELPMRGLAINVQGLYWHYQSSREVVAEQLQRAALEGKGIHVIYIDEDDALRNPGYYVREALNGIDHSRMN